MVMTKWNFKIIELKFIIFIKTLKSFLLVLPIKIFYLHIKLHKTLIKFGLEFRFSAF